MNEPLSAETIDGLSAFLTYGPIGLAGLMLTLVIIALSFGDLGAARERLLKLFMFIGAFCFALSLGANFFAIEGSYPLHFRVIPLDAGRQDKLPAPIIKINSTIVETGEPYFIESEVTAVVDVTDAIDFASEIRLQNDRQREALNTIISESDLLVPDLQRVVSVINNNCPGGPSGVPAASNPAIINITSQAASTVARFRATASTAIAAPLPEPN